MAERNPAIFLQSGAHPAEGVRQLIRGLVPIQGVVLGADLAVSQHAGTPGMSVDVALGTAFIAGTEQVYQGTYAVYNDAVVQKTIATADATNPRKDLVCAQVFPRVCGVGRGDRL